MNKSSATFKNMLALVQHYKDLPNYNRNVGKCIDLVTGVNGRSVVAMTVEKEHCNGYNTLHGGMSATLVDNITTLALVNEDPNSLANLGVSVDMNLTYFKAAKLGEEIIIDAEVVRRGKKLAFTECSIISKETGELLVKARHTKYLLQNYYVKIE